MSNRQERWITIRKAADQLESDGRSCEARDLLEGLLQETPNDILDTERAHAYAILASIDLRQGRFGDASQHAAQAVGFAEASDDDHALSKALYAQGEVVYLKSAWRGIGDLHDALVLHQRCLELREAMGSGADVSESLSRIGVIHERRGEQSQAIDCFERAMRVSQTAGFADGDSRALVHLGAAEDRAGNLEAALDYYERSINVSRVDHDVRALTFDLCNVASALARLDQDLDRAELLLDEALALADRMDWKLAKIRIAQVSGDVLKAQNRSVEARTAYAMALSISDEFGFAPFANLIRERLAALPTTSNGAGLPGSDSVPSHTQVRETVGGDWSKRVLNAAKALACDGRVSVAIDLLQEELVRSSDSLPAATISKIWAAMSAWLWSQGNTKTGRELAEEAVRVAEEADDSAALSDAVYALGDVEYLSVAYYGIGDYALSIQLHQRALELRKQNSDRTAESLSLSRIGVIHERLGQHDQAEACYQSALEIAEDVDDDRARFRPLVHLGVAKERAGDLAGSVDYHRRSLQAVRKARHAHSLSFALCNVAETAVRLDGDLQAALLLLDEAQRVVTAMDFKLGQCRVPLMRGDVLLHSGDPAGADRQYRRSLDIAETEGFPRFIKYLQERIAAYESEGRDI